MVWIFAAAVLYLAVYHEGFRILLLWCGGFAVAFCLLGLIVTSSK
jgi:hypothetical protein